MRHLQDIWTVRNEFRRCSRWHILGLALRKPQLNLLADIYLGLNVSILLLLGGLLENSPWIMLSALVPLFFSANAVTPALRKVYPQEEVEIGLENKYRRNFQYFRFRLFAQNLLSSGLTPARIQELSLAIQLESELAQAHPPAVTRPAMTIQLTLFTGLTAALAGIERLWVQGAIPTMLAVLTLTMYVTYEVLKLRPPSQYHEKELDLFIKWFCLIDDNAQEASGLKESR